MRPDTAPAIPEPDTAVTVPAPGTAPAIPEPDTAVTVPAPGTAPAVRDFGAALAAPESGTAVAALVPRIAFATLVLSTAVATLAIIFRAGRSGCSEPGGFSCEPPGSGPREVTTIERLPHDRHGR
ncbi:hypothetical protein [Actinoplanes sichuanensis]|uniref:Uncharacterized protein n=1 Tax=Actinoplanes sichuanensis TaxID=512349 RepID=A0ABW4A794_9ACTN